MHQTKQNALMGCGESCAQKESAANHKNAKGGAEGCGHHSNSAAAQRQSILEALRKGPVSTLHARRDLDVMHPGGRVLELRSYGHQILTAWSYEPTECGKLHRVGKYVLLQEARE